MLMIQRIAPSLEAYLSAERLPWKAIGERLRTPEAVEAIRGAVLRGEDVEDRVVEISGIDAGALGAWDGDGDGDRDLAFRENFESFKLVVLLISDPWGV